MYTPKKIDYVRVERINTILRLEKINQVTLARKINMSAENLNRIIKLKRPLTEAAAETICVYFPKYLKEWLLGYDPYMTEDEKTRANDSGIRLNAPITVLDTALINICHREGIDVPTLDNIPELMLLQSQLEDYAEMLMSNYLHRKESHYWSSLDSMLDTIERKLKK